MWQFSGFVPADSAHFRRKRMIILEKAGFALETGATVLDNRKKELTAVSPARTATHQ